MDDYKPTVGDLWPDPDDMPDEVKDALQGLAEIHRQQLTEIEANPKHISKTWWQVDTTTDGFVTCVWANKPTGESAGLWTFEQTINAEGSPVIHIVWAKHADEFAAVPVAEADIPSDVDEWELFARLAQFVGRRTARGVVGRLRKVDVSIASEDRHWREARRRQRLGEDNGSAR